MPWECRLINPDEIPMEKRQPGDMWYEPEIIDGKHISSRYFNEFLSPEYFAKHSSHRAPLVIKLPGIVAGFCIDGLYGNSSGGYAESGWDVTGEAPSITMHPSINFSGRYHGWLQNGVLSDDVEGRKFN